MDKPTIVRGEEIADLLSDERIVDYYVNMSNPDLRKALTLKQKKMADKHFQRCLVCEEKYRRKILKWIREEKKKTLKKFDEMITLKALKETRKMLEKVYIEDRVSLKRLKDSPAPIWYEEWKLPASLVIDLEKATPIHVVSIVESEEIEKILDDLFEESFTLGGAGAYAEFDIFINFALSDPEVIAFGENYNLRLARQVSIQTTTRIRNELVMGIREGEDIRRLRNRVSAIYDRPIKIKVPAKLDVDGNVLRRAYSYNMNSNLWATSVARTESIRWSAEGRLNAYAKMGVTKVIFSAAADHRTCQTCAGLDGQEYKLETAKGVIPVHCMGRCSWIPDTDSMEIPKGQTLKQAITDNIIASAA